MTAAAAEAHARAVLGKIDDILDLSRNKLSHVPERTLTVSERYLGFPRGVAAILALYYMPTPDGLTTGGQVVTAGLTWFRVLGITPGM